MREHLVTTGWLLEVVEYVKRCEAISAGRNRSVRDCGGGLIVDSAGNKRGRRPEHVCFRRRHYSGDPERGCPNTLRILVEEMNESVLLAIEEHAQPPKAIEQVILLTERDDVEEQRPLRERENVDIENASRTLVVAIETGGNAIALTLRVRQLETRRTGIAADFAALRPMPRLPESVIADC